MRTDYGRTDVDAAHPRRLGWPRRPCSRDGNGRGHFRDQHVGADAHLRSPMTAGRDRRANVPPTRRMRLLGLALACCAFVALAAVQPARAGVLSARINQAPPSVMLGDSFQISFFTHNTTSADLAGAWMEISYDPSLLDGFYLGGCDNSSVPTRCDMPTLGPTGTSTSSWETGGLARTKAAGTEHFVLTTHTADGSESVATFDVVIQAPPPPPPPTPPPSYPGAPPPPPPGSPPPPQIVGGIWTAGSDIAYGHVYAFEAPDPSAVVATVACSQFDIGAPCGLVFANNGQPGMPPNRYVTLARRGNKRRRQLAVSGCSTTYPQQRNSASTRQASSRGCASILRPSRTRTASSASAGQLLRTPNRSSCSSATRSATPLSRLSTRHNLLSPVVGQPCVSFRAAPGRSASTISPSVRQ